VPFSPRSTAATRIDPIAATWGGLACAIGLMIGAGRDWPARLAITAIAFGIGGFLAGVRASGRRLAHAAAAWLAGYIIHAGFIALATIIDVFVGPTAPDLIPGGAGAWALAALWTLVWAMLGGMLVNRWLTPAGHRG
jgi:hypothetical protein